MSLLDYLKKNYPLSQEKLKDFSRQLLKTVIYLHDKNIVHRDIKPQNILVKFNKNTGQETLKLIDYGFSTLSKFLFNTKPISQEN
jgi:serine/threonine protein kinase